MSKALIKVVATLVSGHGSIGSVKLTTTVARGIQPLKSKQTPSEFIRQFMIERGVQTFSIMRRADNSWAISPIIDLTGKEKTILTYHFVEFDPEDLGYHAKDLSPMELDRDLPIVKKHIAHG